MELVLEAIEYVSPADSPVGIAQYLNSHLVSTVTDSRESPLEKTLTLTTMSYFCEVIPICADTCDVSELHMVLTAGAASWQKGKIQTSTPCRH